VVSDEQLVHLERAVAVKLLLPKRLFFFQPSWNIGRFEWKCHRKACGRTDDILRAWAETLPRAVSWSRVSSFKLIAHLNYVLNHFKAFILKHTLLNTLIIPFSSFYLHGDKCLQYDEYISAMLCCLQMYAQRAIICLINYYVIPVWRGPPESPPCIGSTNLATLLKMRLVIHWITLNFPWITFYKLIWLR